MTKTTDFNLGDKWENELFLSLKRKASRAYAVAAGAIAISVLCVFAVMLMGPAKEFVPIPITISKETGEVRVQLEDDNILSASDADLAVESQLFRYVTARETYDPTDQIRRIRKIGEFTEGQARASLVELYSDDYALNPIKVYGRQGRISVDILSIVLETPRTARLRIRKTIKTDPGVEGETKSFTVLMGFEFRRQGIIEKAQLWENPLSIFVTSYRITEDANK